MIVRETATDDRGLFLISMSDERMYSLKLPTAQDCAEMAQAMRLAIGKCPDEGMTHELFGIRKTFGLVSFKMH